ncbi:MAG: type II toxin-antitoxin system VapC family toxin [Desulfococcaceae bacterium]
MKRRFFFDTSALVKLYHEENGTQELTSLLFQEKPRIVISDLAIIEMISALAKKVRIREIDIVAFNEAVSAFDEDVLRFEVIEIESQIKKTGVRFAEKCRFGKRAQDAWLPAIGLRPRVFRVFHAESFCRFGCRYHSRRKATGAEDHGLVAAIFSFPFSAPGLLPGSIPWPGRFVHPSICLGEAGFLHCPDLLHCVLPWPSSRPVFRPSAKPSFLMISYAADSIMMSFLLAMSRAGSSAETRPERMAMEVSMSAFFQPLGLRKPFNLNSTAANRGWKEGGPFEFRQSAGKAAAIFSFPFSAPEFLLSSTRLLGRFVRP